jgi:hypothetical protein
MASISKSLTGVVLGLLIFPGAASLGRAEQMASGVEARMMAATYAAARVAEESCRMDYVRVNRAFFHDWLESRGEKTAEFSRMMRAEISAAKSRIVAEVAMRGADDWCWDYTSAVFDNYDAPNGPIFYRDELGVWTSPEVQQDFLRDEANANFLFEDPGVFP